LKAIANQFRVAVRDAVNRPSRKPFYWGGLKGYQQLEAIAQVLQRMPVAEDAFFGRLKRQIERTLENNRTLAAELDKTYSWFLRIAACLHYPPSAYAQVPAPNPRQVDQNMKDLLRDFAADAHEQIVPLTLYGGLRHRWRLFGHDLLHCFAIPGLPPDNLKMEGLFGRLRRNQRRISGCKSTQPLRDFGQYQIRFLAVSQDQLLEHLRCVSPQDYLEARKRLARAEDPRLFLHRLHRDPGKTMRRLAESYTSAQSALAKQSEPCPTHTI
jgi:hypothetical protein